MSTIEIRLNQLGSAIGGLVERYNHLRKIDEEKKLVAQEIIGSAYYWGTYSGTIIPYEKDKTKVIAKLVNRETGLDTEWILDAFRVLEHLSVISSYNTWEEYNKGEKLKFAEELEQMMVGYEFTDERIKKEMHLYCKKNNIQYKSYLEEVA